MSDTAFSATPGDTSKAVSDTIPGLHSAKDNCCVRHQNHMT